MVRDDWDRKENKQYQYINIAKTERTKGVGWKDKKEVKEGIR